MPTCSNTLLFVTFRLTKTTAKQGLHKGWAEGALAPLLGAIKKIKLMKTLENVSLRVNQFSAFPS